MTNNFFVEIDDSTIYLKLFEMEFEKVLIPLFYRYGSNDYETELDIDFWKPTGRFQKISPDNPPILMNSLPELQLFRANASGVSAPNTDVLISLYNEALMMYKLNRLNTNEFRIDIADYAKLVNSHPNDFIKNTWIVFREFPEIEPTMRYLIHSEFIRAST